MMAARLIKSQYRSASEGHPRLTWIDQRQGRRSIVELRMHPAAGIQSAIRDKVGLRLPTGLSNIRIA
jgi:hypothetical protein